MGGAMKEHGDAGFGAANGQAREALVGMQELEPGCAFETMLIGGEVFGDLVLGFGDELGGGGRSGGAEVGGEVGDGEVGFVTDGGDDGEAAGSNRASDALAVEGGQIFERARRRERGR